MGILEGAQSPLEWLKLKMDDKVPGTVPKKPTFEKKSDPEDIPANELESVSSEVGLSG